MSATLAFETKILSEPVFAGADTEFLVKWEKHDLASSSPCRTVPYRDTTARLVDPAPLGGPESFQVSQSPAVNAFDSVADSIPACGYPCCSIGCWALHQKFGHGYLLLMLQL
jgi:hypothetical protein